MKKRYFLEIAILVLAIIFISFSAQAYTVEANDGSALPSETSFLLTEESQNLASICTAVYGYVYDKKGNPIPGVKVTANFYGRDYVGHTNINGYYFIRLPDRDGIADMTYEKSGYWTHYDGAMIIAGFWTRLDVTLDYCPIPSTGIIVFVNDAFSGAPIEGATVYVWFDGIMYPPATTDGFGRAEIELPTLGYDAIAHVVVEKKGYWSASKTDVIHSGKWKTFYFRLYPYPQVNLSENLLTEEDVSASVLQSVP